MSINNINDIFGNNKINKTVLTYKEYGKLLNIKKKEENLILSGFFGKATLKIPQNLVLEIDQESKNIFFFFINKKKNNQLLKSLKSFYNSIIFSSYGLIFGHFINMSIKGIGYKFELLKDQIIIYNGNALPVRFMIPEDITILDNNMVNNYSIVGGNYMFLTSFSSDMRNTCIPNKYKEIGIFLQKKL